MQWLSRLPDSKKFLGLSPMLNWGLFLCSSHVLPVMCVSSKCTSFLSSTKTSRLGQLAKLFTGVNVRVDGCLSLCYSLMIDWTPVPEYSLTKC